LISGFRRRFRELLAYDAMLRDRLLTSSAGPTEKPSVLEQLQIKAYCVFLHAAIEEFLEETARELADLSIRRWKSKLGLRPSTALLALAVHCSKRHTDGEDDDASLNMFEELGKKLDIAYSELDKIINGNNGASIKHFKRLLRFVGITFTMSPTTSSAFSHLKQYRGGFAHTNSISSIPSVDDIIRDADSCLEFRNTVSAAALRIYLELRRC
jgi:hypothetical protein